LQCVHFSLPVESDPQVGISIHHPGGKEIGQKQEKLIKFQRTGCKPKQLTMHILKYIMILLTKGQELTTLRQHLPPEQCSGIHTQMLDQMDY